MAQKAKKEVVVGQRKKHGKEKHSINKFSNHKRSKNYKKKYRGQGKGR